MKKILIISLCMIILACGMISTYPLHKQSTDLYYTFTSNNATGCNITLGNGPNGNISINQEAEKHSQTFLTVIDNGIFKNWVESWEGIVIKGNLTASGGELYLLTNNETITCESSDDYL